MLNLNTEQLEKELFERKLSARSEENVKNAEQHDLVLKHVDILLALTPDHQRKSCSDENPCNHSSNIERDYPNCHRCHLIRLKQAQYNDATSIRITFAATPILPMDKLHLEVALKER